MPPEFVPVASGEPVAPVRPRVIARGPSDRSAAVAGPRALYVWQGEYPWDVRVEKIARALTDGGFDTHILARNRQRAPVTEPLPEAVVDRLTPWPWVGRKADAALQTPAFLNPRWIGHVARTIRRTSPAIVVVRDLPLAPAALWTARRFGVPVVLDMAENYPALLRDVWSSGRQRPWDVFARNPTVARAVESYCVRRVDHVVVVVEENAERVAALGVPRDRITVVSNTPERSRALAPRQGQPARDGRPLEVVYLGILEIPRGLDDAIDAIRMLRARSVPIRFKIVGTGRDAALFHERARAAGLTSDDVLFTGYVSREEAMRAVATADVGLLANRRTEQWETSIPNKLFDYMAAGLAVVSSDTAPCARIVHETGAGAVFRAGDAADLARVLEHMTDARARAVAGDAGRRAVLDRYNWERDSALFLDVIESVAPRTTAMSPARSGA
jgi:glycosyltransferase involved in cell wall biosynthesis